MINLSVINLPCNKFTGDKFTTWWIYQELNFLNRKYNRSHDKSSRHIDPLIMNMLVNHRSIYDWYNITESSLFKCSK